MPYELQVPVSLSQKGPPDLAQQRGMHGLFFAALQQADPQLSQAMHEREAKPFTQALLGGVADQPHTWRVTLLEDALYDPFMSGLVQLAEIHLLGQPLHLDVAGVQCRHESYSDLIAAAARLRYRLEFLSPTSFKQRVVHMPLPDPYLCFQSWWTRWHRFAPTEGSINVALLDIIRAHVAIAGFHLSSQLLRDEKRSLVGGIGRMTFIVRQSHKVEPDWWQQMASLAAFARYCGTGSKTTQGLGQTVVTW